VTSRLDRSLLPAERYVALLRNFRSSLRQLFFDRVLRAFDPEKAGELRRDKPLGLRARALRRAQRFFSLRLGLPLAKLRGGRWSFGVALKKLMRRQECAPPRFR
jgi:hypothetical protein